MALLKFQQQPKLLNDFVDVIVDLAWPNVFGNINDHFVFISANAGNFPRWSFVITNWYHKNFLLIDNMNDVG